jgi:hypothetical protein
MVVERAFRHAGFVRDTIDPDRVYTFAMKQSRGDLRDVAFDLRPLHAGSMRRCFTK